MKKSNKKEKKAIQKRSYGTANFKNKKTSTKNSKQSSIYMICALIISLFFSYHPVIRLSSDETMNFELSIPLIILTIFALANIRKAVVEFIGIKNRFVKIFFIMAMLYFGTSVLWSYNRIRGLLVFGIMIMVIIVSLSIINIMKSLHTKEKEKILTVLIYTAVAFGIFCMIQCFIDVLGVSRKITLLCEGCTYEAFGFPHPNGFAIEPQFMGNLLLAPAICAFLMKDKEKKYKIIWIILSIVIFTTFSRGAMYAYIISLFILCTFYLKGFNILGNSSVILGAFIFSLLFQGTLGVLSPANETFIGSVTKSIHHLSLGKVDLRPEKEDYITSPKSNSKQEGSVKKATFSGYVKESTNVRVNLNDLALRTAFDNPKNTLIGVGLGGAGVAMNRHFPNKISKKEIVQNEFISLLLETGIVGVLMLAACLALIMRRLDKRALIIILCFAITLCFFSGLPNALHIYIFTVIIASIFAAKDKFFVENKI